MNAIIVLTAALAAVAPPGGASCLARSGQRTGALLELYTSEGCNSCPPADRWFGGLAATADPIRLSLLEFHVDYWDELGWTDRFARPPFSARQRQRVGAKGSTTVYTPQVMLSSRLDLRWYRPADVSTALAAEQTRPSAAAISLRATPDADAWHIEATSTSTAAAAGAQLYVAFYQDGIVSKVAAGENQGATLHHERVVRQLWGPWPLDAARRWTLAPPAGAAPSRLGITAFIQRPETGETLQALSLPLANCAAGPSARTDLRTPPPPAPASR